MEIGVIGISFIIEIVLLVLAIKKKKKGLWITLYLLNIIPCVLIYLNYIYEEAKPANIDNMFSGFEALGLFILTILIVGYFLIMLTIVSISRVIVYEKEQKRLGKVHRNPLILIIANILTIVAVCYLAADISFNYDNRLGKGTVTKLEEKYYENEYNSDNSYTYWEYVINFKVDGKTYEEKNREYTKPDFNIGDTISIVYEKHRYIENGNLQTEYRVTNNSICYVVYIPVGLIALLLYRIRFNSKELEEVVNNNDINELKLEDKEIKEVNENSINKDNENIEDKEEIQNKE